MNKQEHKNSILSLSACSIPVMLAVAGWSAASDLADLHGSSCFVEGAPANQVVSDEARAVQQGKTAQSDASWFCMSPDNKHFWVSKGQDASIATYRFTDESGNYDLVGDSNEITPLAEGLPVVESQGWIDLELSDDGEFLYQLFGETGTIGVYEIDGSVLTLVEVLSA